MRRIDSSISLCLLAILMGCTTPSVVYTPPYFEVSVDSWDEKYVTMASSLVRGFHCGTKTIDGKKFYKEKCKLESGNMIYLHTHGEEAAKHEMKLARKYCGSEIVIAGFSKKKDYIGSSDVNCYSSPSFYGSSTTNCSGGSAKYKGTSLRKYKCLKTENDYIILYREACNTGNVKACENLMELKKKSR